MAIKGLTLPRKFPKISKRKLNEGLAGYIFASPFIIGFFVFTAYPMLYSLWLSFQKWDLLTPPKFVAWSNFIRAWNDPIARLSLSNSAYYTFIAVPLQLIFAFALAMALSRPLRGRDFYRAGFYMPIIIPLVASAVVWQRVFHPEFGILNEALSWFGVEPRKWLFEPGLAKPAFILMSFWMIGRMMVIFIAGLGNISPALYEAASLDGAGPWKRLMHVTIPMMTPLIFYNSVIAIINSFQTFVPALIMTDGGPQNATLFAVLNIYRQGFNYFNMGYAAALSWEFFIIIVGFTIAQFVLSDRWVFYEQ